MKVHRYGNRRSATSLMASGAATISLSQKLNIIHVKSTHQALRDDQKALCRDFKRAAFAE